MKGTALYEIKDVILEVRCPYCASAQNSPTFPDSQGWDMNDLRRIGPEGMVVCRNRKCRRAFTLPVELFGMVAEELARRQTPLIDSVPRTARQREILQYIWGFMERNGYQPSYMQIARRMNVRSKATIAKHLMALELRGLLKREHVDGHFAIRFTRASERIVQVQEEKG